MPPTPSQPDSGSPRKPTAPATTPTAATDSEPVKKRRRKPATIRIAALNITAFMDLTFNLLLFFVLTASFAGAEGILPATLPAGGGPGSGGAAPEVTPAANDAQTVYISLRSLGETGTLIQIEGAPNAPKDFEALYDLLNRYRLDSANPSGVWKPETPIVIRPTNDVRWDAVVDAFNAVMRAKYKDVGFAPASN